MKRAIIQYNQQGWVVYPDNESKDFYLFKSNEPERFVKFVCETVAGINIDQVVQFRVDERALAARKMAGE